MIINHYTLDTDLRLYGGSVLSMILNGLCTFKILRQYLVIFYFVIFGNGKLSKLIPNVGEKGIHLSTSRGKINKISSFMTRVRDLLSIFQISCLYVCVYVFIIYYSLIIL